MSEHWPEPPLPNSDRTSANARRDVDATNNFGWLRVLLMVIGCMLLLPGACGLFFAFALPNPAAGIGVGLGMLGIILIYYARAGRRG
jgi:hypothetical protein